MATLELLFENPEEDIYEYKPSSVSLKQERTCSASTLDGTIPDVTGHVIKMGATCRLFADGELIFYGYVFSANIDRWGVMSFTAHDCLRYLRNTFSNYYPRGYKPVDVIKDICKAFNVKVGTLDDIPATGWPLLCDNESGLDIISKLVDTAIVLTKKIIVFYAEGDKVYLKYADDMIRNEVVGDNSLSTEYSLSISIDEDTYNQIFLYRESSASGGRHYVVAESKGSDSTVNKWGILRYSESVEDGMTDAQMQDKADKLLEMKNREFKSMTISALGIVGLRAGQMLTIDFPSLADPVSKRQIVCIDSVTHNFEDSTHTMELEVRTFWRDS